MLKISEGKKEKQSITLILEGRIVGPWTGELQIVGDGLLGEGMKVTLNLADVSFADEKGVALLGSLRQRGVKLLRPSPFVAEQLKTVTAPAA
jgi:ABC-type transporter Mla MlaB component